MKKIFRKMIYVLLALVLLVYGGLYFFQEKLLFHPYKLPANYTYSFAEKFEEISIPTADGLQLSALLFTIPQPKGLIFYLHGNGGALDGWGEVAPRYLNLGYDVFLLDYRGYGKSEGHIYGQEQMYDDAQRAYDVMRKRYPESEIIALGYSMGTGLATKIAADNDPKMLILQAPYFSLVDVVRHKVPIVPPFLVKYHFRTDQNIQACDMPIVIFHGDQDEVIYYESSVKLKALTKPGDTLITLPGQGHNGITDNAQYLAAMAEILK